MNREKLAQAIYNASHLEGEFLLRSGLVASEYFDKYRFESDPVLLRELAQALVPAIPAETDVLAGLELGGVPIATVLSQLTGLPTLFVRKEAKKYGTCQLAEGCPVSGRRLLLVEDVVTSGGQIVISANELRQRGAIVDHALCVVNREQGANEKLEASEIQLYALYRASELTD